MEQRKIPRMVAAERLAKLRHALGVVDSELLGCESVSDAARLDAQKAGVDLTVALLELRDAGKARP